MMIGKIRNSRGFTLVELMIVVVIIGILAALAIFGVKRYVSNSKSAEARMAVGRMGKDAASAYEGERMGGATLALGATVGTSRRLCDDATPVPATIAGEGEKYQPAAGDWVAASPSADAGWECVKFSMEQPIYFQYNYQATVSTPGAAGDLFTASGQAAMDGVFMQIFLNGNIQAEASGALTLTVSPSLCEASAATASAGILDTDGNCIDG